MNVLEQRKVFMGEAKRNVEAGTTELLKLTELKMESTAKQRRAITAGVALIKKTMRHISNVTALSILLVVLFAFSAQALVVAHIADAHIGIKSNDERLTNVIWMVNQQANVAVIAGDLTQKSTDEQFGIISAMLDDSTIPVLAVRGNHDKSESFESWIGDRHWFYDINDADYEYRIIGIDTFAPDFNLIENFMQTGRIMIVVDHRPIKGSRSLPIKKDIRAELLELFAEYNVLCYLTGHNHKASYNVEEDSGTLLIGSGAAKQGNYNLLFIDGRNIETYFMNVKRP